MQLAVQCLAIACAFLVVALLYTLSLLRSALASIRGLASDAITASRSVSATDYVQARAFNKLTDTPIKDLPPPPPAPAPRVFTTPEGHVLEPLRPR